MLLIFLDTETTGLSPDRHRAIEIAYKIIDSETQNLIVSYQSIISQSREVWEAADTQSLRINGFSYEKVLSGKSEQVVASEIINDFNRAGLPQKGGVFICQNPSFDRSFFIKLISVDLQNNYHWPYHWLDFASMYWASLLLKDKKETHTLKEEALSKNNIAKKLGLPEESLPHQAMNGVNHLIQCYHKLFDIHPSLN